MSETPPEREQMEFDVVIVGAGPAGLSAAIRLKQLAAEAGSEINVVVVEKGSEVGAHILSGAVIDPAGMTALFPDWKEKGAPLETAVTDDKFLLFGEAGSIALPHFAMPGMVKNHGNYIASLGNICRWLAEQAEAMEIEVFPGMAASEFVRREDGSVAGVVVGKVGVGKDGEPKGDFEPGVELLGKYVLLGEGVRGSLSQKAIAEFGLAKDSDPQKYGIGLKELWKVPDENFRPGYVQHSFGWPLDDKTGGGSFMYHFGDNFVAVGFVVHLNYANPYVAPHEEFQRLKTHPEMRKYLEGGERVAYGARAISEGGFQSVPKLTFPGGALVGCSAGFVNVPRIKGSHNAMLTGVMAAEAAFEAIAEGREGDELTGYAERYENSSVRKELHRVRNAKPLWSKYGTLMGGIGLTGLDLWTNTLFSGFSVFGTMAHGKADHETTQPAENFKPIDYPKPDGKLTFDRLTNLSFSATNHEEDQPAHLKLKEPEREIDVSLAVYAGPAQRYCPAGVYEYVYDDNGENPKFQINAQNCVHCKTCDVKEPGNNIVWTTPEGGGGPNYPNM